MLLIGPPGSGKTALILKALKKAIRAGRSDEVLFLVPNASMREHMRNRLAREDLMVPARVVLSLPEFVRELTPDVCEASGVLLDRLLAQVLESGDATDLPSHAGSVRLRSRIRDVIGDFWAAGSDSYQVQPVARTRQQRRLAGIFQDLEDRLKREGLAHHNQRISQAAQHIKQHGLGAVRSVYADGFDLFTKQQEELLDALDEQAEELLVAMPAGLPRYPPGKHRQLPPPAAGGSAKVELIEAASPRAEVLEIARSILSGGRELHEHAIIMRSPERYAGLIREVLEALNIPHRFWGRDALADHGAARHFSQWLRVIESQFPAEPALEAISAPLSPIGGDPATDEFDFAVREALPGKGLEFLAEHARGFPQVKRLLQALGPCERWHRRRVSAKRWKQDCLWLLEAVQQLRPPADAASFQRTCDWRGTLQARKALARAIEEAADLPEFSGRKRPSLGDFAEALEDVLRNTPLSVPDQRFEVVHVLPIGESRQWSVPVAYVCGLVEDWFPRRFPQDIFFDDQDRLALREREIDLRTSGDRAAAELRLFEVATTRATERLVMSYPVRDGRGEALWRSRFVEDRTEQARRSASLRIGSPAMGGPAEPANKLPASLLPAVQERNASFSVSGISDFRQCPYLYFSGTTLQLRGRPPLPEQRLDTPTLGSIAHKAIDTWHRDGGQIEQVSDKVFAEALQELHLEQTFRTERYRVALRADLVRFANTRQTTEMALAAGTQSHFEETSELRISSLQSQPVVSCRIDRYDIDRNQGCRVTDYKYARPDRVKALFKQHLEGEELQLMLYLAALEQQQSFEPAGMALCGLRGEVSLEGAAVDGEGGLQALSREEMRSLLDMASSEAADAVGDVLGGAIAVRPRNRDFCSLFCEFGSVCRVDWRQQCDGGQAKDGSA